MPNALNRVSLPHGIHNALLNALDELRGHTVQLRSLKPLSGGSIHHVYQVETSDGYFCLKWASPPRADMLAREVQNLGLLRETHTVPLPRLYQHGDTQKGAYFLLMEWLEPGLPHSKTWEQLGRNLASLHRHHHDRFGLHYDNYIGWLSQPNKPKTSWAAFFVEARLEPQVKMASDRGLIDGPLRSRFRRL